MWIYYGLSIFIIAVRINEKVHSITILNLFDNFIINQKFQMLKNIEFMSKKYVKIIL